MSRKLFGRAALGLFIGVFVSQVISLIISYCHQDGLYTPVVPELIQSAGNELNAVTVQFLLSALMGIIIGGASIIWEKKEWSLLRQSLLFFAIILVATLPPAYVCHWMDHNLWGILRYCLIFVVTYLFAWGIQYVIMRLKIKKINQKLEH